MIITWKDIEAYLSEVKDAVKKGRYRIARNSKRQDNIDLFLDYVIDELELDAVVAVHGRAEDLARKEEYREQFDLCVSRAVANLASLSEYCIPFVKIGGMFVAYKSGSSEEEIGKSQRAISLLSGRLKKVEEFTLPDSDISRCFVMVEKVKETKGKYPRKAGMPGKDPL